MTEYMYVSMSMKCADYDAIVKVVPDEFKQKTYRDLVSFMIQDGDNVGNAPLTAMEKELATRAGELLGSTDPNVKVYAELIRPGNAPKSVRLEDKVGSSPDAFSRAQDTAIDGNPVEYDQLDFRLARLETGGC